jgi:uncharacterized protein YfaS (alpha-2-macroglobulin family)
MARDIATLRLMQNWDGGFPYWTKGNESIPYNSVFVTHALLTARAKDYAVPQEMLDGGLATICATSSNTTRCGTARGRATPSAATPSTCATWRAISITLKARNLYNQCR